MPMFFKNEEGKGQMETIPLLPLRDVVIFPYMVAPLFVGREKSIRALEEAMKKSKEIFLVAQRDAKTNDPQETDIYDIGTIGTIVQMLRLPDGTVKVLVEGKKRAKVLNYLPNKGYFLVEVEVIPEPQEVGVETEALIRTL
ncbi:MAG TPA: LON peptidase substrate-binding domain-containing protein, partial [Thermodesulfobacteriota bacterium]|nr:LON peptidase substrate-binding domain-containing protein [Thermodesulfobacteriota bacterium]